MIFENLVTENKEAFLAKVQEIADKLGIPGDWLMACMAFESNISPSIQNKFGATGLIQFMPETAKNLGTTTDKLKAMSNVEQLDYVYKYLRPYKNKFNKLSDVYLTILYPAAVGKADTYQLGGETFAKNNPAFDTDKDLKVNKKDVEDYLIAWIKKKTGVDYSSQENTELQSSNRKKKIAILCALIGAGVLALYLIKK